jgi:phytoene desaturase
MTRARSGRIGVVGGGLGGLAAACTLAARGYAVTLFEKSQWLGGKAAVLDGGGFRFDMGPTILTLPSVLRRIFGEAGRRLGDSLTLLRLEPQWRCFFPGGSTLDLLSDPGEMGRRLEAFAPGTGSAEGYRGFLDFAARLHDISERFFFWRSIGSLWDMMDLRTMFQPAMLGDVLRMRLGKTVAECVRSHVTEPRVAQMLDHFTQYVGSAPDASPAVLCGIAHMQTGEGVWYPEGGTGAVPRALARLAADLGVDLRTGTGVRRILVDGGPAADALGWGPVGGRRRRNESAVCGVETETGERVPLAAVVSNADSVRTHRELLGGSTAARRFERRRRYEPACSGVVLYLGLGRAYEHLAHHNFVFSGDPHQEFEAIYRRGEPAEDPTCYVCAPARTEPGVAPPGGEALYVLVHTPYLRPGHDWPRMLPAYRRTVLRKLAETAGLDDLEGRIRFEACLTPEDIRRRYRVLDGAIYGLASHGRLLGAFKPANRSPDVAGLYLAGGAAHPGPGMPMALMSGWIAADALDQDGAVERTPRGPAYSTKVAVSPCETISPLAERAGDIPLPRPSAWLLRLFTRYVRRYLTRNFRALRLSRGGRPEVPAEGPLVIVLNHPSWWDPLVAIVLKDLFPRHSHYAPIGAAALGRYRFFERLGFFGVEQGTRQGALAFLRTGAAVLARPDTALWVTAQGRFTDPRERPVRLRPGVAHLLRRLEGGVVLPLALEYPFWEERYPEALARFGTPVPIGRGRDRPVDDWLGRIEAGLGATQDALAAEARRRDPKAFEVLVGGKAGVGGVYDLWRRLRAWLRGGRFRSAHGSEEFPAAPRREVASSLPTGSAS